MVHEPPNGHSTRPKSNQHLGLLSGGQNPGVTTSQGEELTKKYVSASLSIVNNAVIVRALRQITYAELHNL